VRKTARATQTTPTQIVTELNWIDFQLKPKSLRFV
jgi:hypothetical protein